MRKWKKVAAVLLAGAVLVSATGCRSAKEGKQTTDKKEQEEKQVLEYVNKEPVNLWDSVEDMAYYNEEITGQAVTQLIPYVAEETSGAGCVVICPGGGYQHHALEKEGTAVAEAFNANGITAFVLSYRVKPYEEKAILSDVGRAVKFVRYHAEEFGIDPEKIAVMGFSAGGHLAAMKVVYNQLDTGSLDAIDKVSDKVDCGVLCYPVLTFRDPYAHRGSRTNFLGALADDEEARQKYSAELQVNSDTPPCFVWHCKVDKTVPYQNSEMFAGAMEQAGVECKLNLYLYGAHGLGLATTNQSEVKDWFPDCVTWLKNRGY